MDDLLKDMQTKCGINRNQAESALGLALCFLAARLPSPIMGRIKAALAQTTAIGLPVQKSDADEKLRY